MSFDEKGRQLVEFSCDEAHKQIKSVNNGGRSMDASVSSVYPDWTTFPCKEQPQRLIFYSGFGKSFVSLWMPLCGDKCSFV